MPAYVNLPWLDISPKDFLQAAMSGARQALEASSLATKAGIANDRTPRLANSGLPSVVSPSPVRGETELDKAQAALALARANEIQDAITNPAPAPPVRRYQAVGEGGPPGLYDLTTGEFTQNPMYTPTKAAVVGPRLTSVPLLVPGEPNPITGQSTDKTISVAPEIARGLLLNGPENIRTNAFNRSILPAIEAAQSPSGNPLEGKRVRDKQTNQTGTISNGVFVPDEPATPDATPAPQLYMGSGEDAPAEDISPGFNMQ